MPRVPGAPGVQVGIASPTASAGRISPQAAASGGVGNIAEAGNRLATGLAEAEQRNNQRDDFLRSTKELNAIRSRLADTMDSFSGQDMANPDVRDEAIAAAMDVIGSGREVGEKLRTKDAQAEFAAKLSNIAATTEIQIKSQSFKQGIADTIDIIEQDGATLTQTASQNPEALLDQSVKFLDLSLSKAEAGGVAPSVARDVAGEQIGAALGTSVSMLARNPAGVEAAESLIASVMADPRLADVVPTESIGKLQGTLALARTEFDSAQREVNFTIDTLVNQGGMSREAATRVALNVPSPSRSDFEIVMNALTEEGQSRPDAARNAAALLRAQGTTGTETERARLTLTNVLNLPEGTTLPDTARLAAASAALRLSSRINPQTGAAVFVGDPLAEAAAERLGFRFTPSGRLVDLQADEQGAAGGEAVVPEPAVSVESPGSVVVGLSEARAGNLQLPDDIRGSAVPPTGTEGEGQGIPAAINNMLRVVSLGLAGEVDSQTAQDANRFLQNLVVDALRPPGTRDAFPENMRKDLERSINLNPSLFQRQDEFALRIVTLRERMVIRANELQSTLTDAEGAMRDEDRGALQRRLLAVRRALNTPPFNAPILGPDAGLSDILNVTGSIPPESVVITIPASGKPQILNAGELLQAAQARAEQLRGGGE